LALFNEAYGSQHPLNAVEMKNESGKTLDGGAITIFDAGAYAGEALVETVKANDKRLISYGVDLGTRITTAFDSSSKMLSEFTLRRGLLTTRSAVKEIRTYTIRNVDSKEKTIVIERPARDGYKTVSPEPVEKTATTLRYEVKAGPAATVKFPVEEERVLTNSVYITNLTYDHIVQYTRNKELDAAARAKLEPIADLKHQIAGLDNEINHLEQDIQRVFEDQNRIRQNISTLRSVTGQQDQVQEYAQKLATQEAELVAMRDRQADRRQQKTGLERKLNDLIETLVI
jgi:prefoldin subunit 5